MQELTEELKLDLKIDEYLNKKESAPRERDYFYVSEVGKSKKAIYESVKNLKNEKYDARVKRIFDNGNDMHSRYYKYLAEMGMLIAAEVTAVENDLFHGRADAIISDKKQLYVLDLKSCSQWTFQKLTDAMVEHKIQVQFYMHFLNIKNGLVLYENKDNQSMKVFKVDPNPIMVEKYIEEFRKFKEDMNKGIIPEDKPIVLEDIEYGV